MPEVPANINIDEFKQVAQNPEVRKVGVWSEIARELHPTRDPFSELVRMRLQRDRIEKPEEEITGLARGFDRVRLHVLGDDFRSRDIDYRVLVEMYLQGMGVLERQATSTAQFIRPDIDSQYSDFGGLSKEKYGSGPSVSTAPYQVMAEDRKIREITGGTWLLTDGILYTVPSASGLGWVALHNEERGVRERTSNVGEFRVENGLIGFVNEKGELFIGQGSEENRKALEVAGYRNTTGDSKSFAVPFARGEETVDASIGGLIEDHIIRPQINTFFSQLGDLYENKPNETTAIAEIESQVSSLLRLDEPSHARNISRSNVDILASEIDRDNLSREILNSVREDNLAGFFKDDRRLNQAFIDYYHAFNTRRQHPTPNPESEETYRTARGAFLGLIVEKVRDDIDEEDRVDQAVREAHFKFLDLLKSGRELGELRAVFATKNRANTDANRFVANLIRKTIDFLTRSAEEAGLEVTKTDIFWTVRPKEAEPPKEKLFGQLAQGYGELYTHSQSKEAMAKIREVEEQLDEGMKTLIAEEERYNRLVEDSKRMDRLLRDAKDYWTWLTYSGDAGKNFLQTRFPILQKFFAHAPDELKEAFQTYTAPIDKELPYEDKQAIRSQRQRDFGQALDAQKSKDAPSQAEVATAERLSRSFDYLASLFIQALQVGSPLEQLEQAFKERDRVRISQLAALNAIKEKELAWFVDTLDRAGLTKEG